MLHVLSECGESLSMVRSLASSLGLQVMEVSGGVALRGLPLNLCWAKAHIEGPKARAVWA